MHIRKQPSVSLQSRCCALLILVPWGYLRQASSTFRSSRISPHILLNIILFILVYSVAKFMYDWVAHIAATMPGIGSRASVTLAKQISPSFPALTFLAAPLLCSFNFTRNLFSLTIILCRMTQQYITSLIAPLSHRRLGKAII